MEAVLFLDTDYTQLMEALRTGERQEFSVAPEDFMAFQTAYMNYEYRKRIIGMAGLGGRVIYHFDQDDKTVN